MRHLSIVEHSHSVDTDHHSEDEVVFRPVGRRGGLRRAELRAGVRSGIGGGEKEARRKFAIRNQGRGGDYLEEEGLGTGNQVVKEFAFAF